VHRALVERARVGDREAFDALARMVADQCMAITFRILRDADRADDAVQAALISAWRQLRTLKNPDAFEPWLHKILTNECCVPRTSAYDARLNPPSGGSTDMGDKGPGSKGGGKKPKTSTKKKGAGTATKTV